MALNLIRINQIFEKIGRQIIRFRWLLLLIFIGLIAFSVTGLKKLHFDSSNDAWYFEDDDVVVTENKFEKIFGNSDIAVVLLKSSNIMTKENLETIRQLSEELEDKVPYVDDVTSITSLEFIKGTEWGIDIGDLVPDEIPQDQKLLRQLFDTAMGKHSIKNRLISDDGTETFIIMDFNKFPDNWKHDENYANYINAKKQKYPEDYGHVDNASANSPDQLVGSLINAIVEQDKYQGLNPIASGVYPMTNEKRHFFQTETPRLIKIGLLLSILVLAISLRSLRGTIFPIITTVGGLIITLGIEGYFGVTTQPSLLPFPLFLGLAVSVGYSIHVFNFYKEYLNKTGDRKESVVYAIEKTGWPLLFTALTTIFALLSFVFLKIKVMNWIGYTTSTIIAVTYILSIVIFPIFLSFGKNRNVKIKEKAKEGGWLANKLGEISHWTMKNPIKILVIYSLFVVITVIGLVQTEVDFDNERTMGRKVAFVDKQLKVSESQIGSFSNYSICIEFPEKNQAKNPKILRKLDQFIKEVEAFKLTRRTTSILDKLKEVNKVLNADDEAFYRIPETRPMIAQSLLLYENAGGSELDKWVNYNYDKLRIRVELVEYEQAELIKENKDVTEIGRKYFPDAKVTTVGSIAKFSDMSDKVAFGQVKAFCFSMLIISVLMMMVFGSVKVGLIGIIPNISPALIVGGIMGYLNIPLDMIMSTLMPMLLGLAVDDTIHFINHAKYEFQKTGKYNLSIENTFRSVGKSLVMTSIVMIINFSAYTTSVASLYIHFGLLAGAGILTALVSDLFVTPVCLKLTHAFGIEKD